MHGYGGQNEHQGRLSVPFDLKSRSTYLHLYLMFLPLLQKPAAKGQRFIVSQGKTVSPKTITDALGHEEWDCLGMLL